MKVITGLEVDDTEIKNTLYEICDSVHATCSEDCPVYAMNGGPVNPKNQGCDCFKDGAKMLDFLRRKKKMEERLAEIEGKLPFHYRDKPTITKAEISWLINQIYVLKERS